MKRVNYFELDLPLCGNVHGVSPCTATETGDDKCYNSRATCNDLENFRLSTPEVEDIAGSDFESDATTHNVDMPDEVDVGDLLITVFGNDSTDTVTTPAGWTRFFTDTNGSDIRGGVYAKVAAGTEGGTSVNFITSGSEAASAQVYRILKNRWYGSLQDGVEISFDTPDESDNLEAPALTPSWGEATNLWIVGVISSSDIDFESAPSGFGGTVVETTLDLGDTGADVRTAYKVSKADSISPGDFEFEDDAFGVVFTLAVRPFNETTLRFCTSAMYNDRSFDALPNLLEMAHTPQILSLGENLGERGSVKVSFEDHPHPDTGHGYDPYLKDRTYNPYELGTHWGKFRARHAFIQGTTCRMLRGYDGDTIDAMEAKNFILDGMAGPSTDWEFVITAKDILKLLDGDKAQAPAVCTATASDAIGTGTTSIDMSPPDIGDIDFGDSGYVCIGGKEVCSYERSGDTLTVDRGELGTTAVSHDSGVRLQEVLVFEGEDVPTILQTLLVNYGGIPNDLIPFSAWDTEASLFLNRNYTAYITEPTSVKKLCSEIIEQAGLAVWSSDEPYQINLQVLRGVTGSTIDENVMMKDSLEIEERTDKRLSQVWTFYAPRDVTRPLDEESNYASVLVTVDEDAAADYATPGIKKIFSRWIQPGGQTAAERVNNLLLAQYRRAPRRFKFDLFADNNVNPVLGNGHFIVAPQLQDPNGGDESVPIIITSVKSEPDKVAVVAEEVQIGGADLVDLDGNVLVLNSDQNNVDLLEMHDQQYNEAEPGDNVYVFINSGVVIGTESRGSPALTIEGFDNDVNIYLILEGRIQGHGGEGGGGGGGNGGSGDDGQDGGTALYVRNDVNIDAHNGEIWGGGGGGGGGGGANTGSSDPESGGGGGGGGAGTNPGDGNGGGGGTNGGGKGHEGNSGDDESGGEGGNGATGGADGGDGGDGGDPGENGQDGSNGGGGGGGRQGGDGGNAGRSIDGVSFLTYGVWDGDDEVFTPGATGDEDIRGPDDN